MRLTLSLPRLLTDMSLARIEIVYPAASEMVATGSKILDLSVDLSAGFRQDCPPISHYRFVAREAARLVSVDIEVGELCSPGDVIAQFEIEAEGDDRPLRVTIAGITSHPNMWSALAEP